MKAHGKQIVYVSLVSHCEMRVLCGAVPAEGADLHWHRGGAPRRHPRQTSVVHRDPTNTPTTSRNNLGMKDDQRLSAAEEQKA